jgi:lipopolysaccharide export system permease protein
VFLAPFIALLGSIMALGGLANGRELIAMQASGVSPYQITGAVIKVVIVFILMVACLEEFVAPSLDQQAHLKRYVALSDTRAYQGEEGLWFREGTRFVRIQKVMYGEIPQGIDIFEFDKEGNLKVYLHAQEAEVENPQIWTLKNIKRNMISGLDFTEEYVSRLDWESPLKQEEMKLLTLPTAFLAPSDLYQYIGVLQQKKHNSLRYELAFWEKVFMPLTTGLMRATIGKRIFWGALAGFGYFLIKEILEPIALLIGASPFITTVTPFLLLSSATIVFWRKYFH